jgi:hypothetical protein
METWDTHVAVSAATICLVAPQSEDDASVSRSSTTSARRP